MSKLSDILIKIFHWLFFALSLFLFVCSVFVTATHEKYENGGVQEFAKVTVNNIPATIMLLIIGIIITFALFCLFSKIEKKINVEIFAIGISVLAFLLSVIWINILCIVPGADQEFCVNYANAINAGDYSSLDRGGYLSNYPHLLGLVAILRFLFRIFGEGNYQAFRYFNALCVPLLIYSGYRITKKISEDNKAAELFYLISMLLCIPIYGYVLYIYGDLGGPSFGMLAFWMFLESLDSNKAGWKAGLFIGAVMTIVLRKSNAIFLMAMAVVLLLSLLKKIKKNDIINLAVLIVSAVFAIECVNWPYLPNKVNPDYAVPVTANIAMGLNYDYGYAGWYNYYELVVMSEHDSIAAEASKEATELMKETLAVYLANPKLGVDFFFNKINSQWQSPLYQSIVSNNLFYGGQNDFVMSVFFGKIGNFFETFMKMYQMMFYGCIAFLLWNRRKSCVKPEHYTAMIAVFGGFLLSLVWESKGRYIFPYFLIMIPAFSFGAKMLYSKLQVTLCKRDRDE